MHPVSKQARVEDEPNAEGTDAEATAQVGTADAGQAGEEELEALDPRTQLMNELEKEFGSCEDDFEVVIGPTIVGEGPSAQVQSSSRRSQAVDTVPAFRFSGSSLTAKLHLPLLPEQEEALKATGVNSGNYPEMLNPGGRNRRRNALEDDLDQIEPAKWRDPGAVQSDFFNYGLNEHTWKEYAARQVALRLYRLENLKKENPQDEET